MKLLITWIFFSIIFIADNIQAELSSDGKNVCLQIETYEETVEVEIQKPIIEKKKKMCWKITEFFRCETSVTKLKSVKEPQVVQRTKIVPKCCDGYEVTKGKEDKCSPVCLNGCKNGECVAPDVCACSSGFYGSQCEKTCPRNFWGNSCINKCDCSNNGNCDNVSGECHCNVGWRGKSCELPCQDGFYGHYCEEKCNCDKHLCNHKTGECITTTENVVVTQFSTVKEWTVETPVEIYQPTKTVTIKEGFLLKSITAKEIVSSEITSDTSNIMVTLGDERASTKITEEPNKGLEAIILKQTTFSPENEGKAKISKEKISVLETFITSNSTENKWDRMSLNESEKNLDKNEIKNFISERKKNLSDKRTLTLFHFLPSLSLISSVSFLIFIITAKWIISKHRKKTGKMAIIARKKEKLFQSEEQIKFQAENFFWVNNCTKNPLPDIELNTTPILETFKPVTPNKGFISKEKEIK